jgi:hypothetical protein
MNKGPKLVFDCDPREPRSGCVRVHNLKPDLVFLLQGREQSFSLLKPILWVRVGEPAVPRGQEFPVVFGRYQILQSELRFTPYFPFESGLRYRASFDPRPLGRPESADVLTLEFSFPSRMSTLPAHVEQVFPSHDLLPENLLRFYIRFSNSMQRGRAEQQIRIVGPDGRPAPDVLYRPPVELWDRSMRYLTILLDPGRLKRGVGPNRELGPPLKAGLDYQLVVGSGMLDASGRPMGKSFHKAFRVTEPVREPIAASRWVIQHPSTGCCQPLTLLFPRPLDWALLWHTITVASKDERLIPGRIAIDQNETRWSFTPTSPWVAGMYQIHVGSVLEDVCGNSITGAFDRPLRKDSHLAAEIKGSTLVFQLT